MRRHTFLFLLLSALSFLHAADSCGQDNYTFLNIGNDAGLSQSNVKCITQDNYGFMWFGTKNGLNRFDGRNMVQKECYDPVKHCGNQNISALYEDGSHTLWIGTDAGVYLYDQTTEKTTFFDKQTTDGQTVSNWIACIIEDQLGDIWIVSPAEGVFRYHDGELFSYFTEPPYRKSPSWITVSANGDVWLSTWYLGVYRFNRQKDAFVLLEEDINGLSLIGLEINMICSWNDNLLLPTQSGQLYRYDTKTRQLYDITPSFNRSNIIRTVSIHRDQIWMGSYDGVHILDDHFQEVAHLCHDRLDKNSLSDNIIYCSYEDSEHGVWIGTMFGGISYLPQRSIQFHALTPSNSKAMPSERIREMAADGDGGIWAGTEDASFFFLDLDGGTIRQHESPVPTNVTLSVATHGRRVFLSYFKEGMEVLEPDGRSRVYTLPEMGLEGNSVYAIYFSREGDLWIGTDGGLYRSRGSLTDFVCVKEDIWAFDVLEALDGSLWIATIGSGVYRYQPQADTICNYRSQTGAEGEIGSNSVSSITQDSRGRLWFSTERGGLCLYRPDTDDFQCITTRDGLPDNMVYKVQEDRKGRLWFGTNHGLVLYDPDNGRVRIFTTMDGIPGNEFNYKSVVVDRDGRFFMGTTEGITWFRPSDEHLSLRQPPIYLTRMSLFGHEVRPGAPDSPLEKSMLATKSITLPYDQANISFDVALPDYANRLAENFEYRLEPVDKEWIRSGGNWSISYANLSPGTYQLHVRALTAFDGDAPYSDCQLSIHILPPWWQSRLALLLYTLFFAGMLTYWFHWYRRRKNRQLAEQKHLFEVEKEKELYESKVNFFTQIAHEIRTPLTLITGPLEVINRRAAESRVEQTRAMPRPAEEKDAVLNRRAAESRVEHAQTMPRPAEEKDAVLNRRAAENRDKLVAESVEAARATPKLAEEKNRALNRRTDERKAEHADDSHELQTITRNVDRLMTLATQLLDFQRLAEQEMNLTLETVDVTALVHETVNRFEDAFRYRDKSIEFIPADDIVTAVIDREAVTKILSNLFNNALKYCERSTVVTLTHDRREFHLRVTSDGPRIPDERSEEIFRPFVQLAAAERSSGGIGIGLGMARSLALLHHGTLSLDRHHAQNSFVLTIPFATEQAAPTSSVEAAVTTALAAPVTSEDVSRYALLVVEDDEEILQFLCDQLRTQHTVFSAHNGQEALDFMAERDIDLVITDLMMPVMDGYTLCERIKADADHSQTPVIILTARNDIDSKLRSLQCGAEAYIEKPFSVSYLLGQISTILSNRHRERVAFSRRPYIPENSRHADREEQELVDRIIATIEQNLRNDSFGVSDLAEELCMSRSSLLRRIRALFHVSPVELMRLVRLKHAAELIQDGRYRLGEISAMVGFNSPSYFSKLFARQFDMTPSEFERQVEQQRTKVGSEQYLDIQEMIRKMSNEGDETAE